MASKYDGRSAAAPEAITSRSDEPAARSASVRRPPASIVGSRSTCRTGVSIDHALGASILRGTGLISLDDQRDVQRRFVGEQAVRQLAVLAEALAVIGR